MEALKNTEDWCMAREDDTGETRTRFFCLKCPLEEDCSASSWKNAKAWSYQGEWEVRCYVYRHLTTSSKHSMNATKAQTVASDIIVETEEDTYEDRELCRSPPQPPAPTKEAPHGSGGAGILAPLQPKGPPGKRARYGNRDWDSGHGSSGWHSGGGGGGGGSSSDTFELVMAARAMQDTAKEVRDALLQQRQQASPAPADSHGNDVLTLSRTGEVVVTQETVPVPLSSLRLMHSSVRSVRKSAEEMAVMIPVLSAAEHALQQFISP